MKLMKAFGCVVVPQFAGCVVLALGLVSASADVQESKKVVANGEVVRVQNYPSTISTGMPIMWVAIAKGFCEAHNLKCVLVDIPSAPLGLQALAGNSIEISQAATDVLMQSVARGLDAKLIASPYPPVIWTFASHKDVSLPNKSKGYPEVMHDLKGKRIGVTARGSASEIFVRALLEGANMKMSDVTIVAVGAASTAYQAMVARQVDAHMGFEPFQTLCLVQNVCQHVVDPRIGQGPAEINALNGAYGSYAARTSYIEKNPKVIKAFLQATEESAAWIKDPKNFDELLMLTKKYVSLGDTPNADEVMRTLLKTQIPGINATVDRKAVQATADFLLKYGAFDKPFDLSDFIYEGAPYPK